MDEPAGMERKYTYMAKIENTTLKNECKRLADTIQWEVGGWRNDHMAVAVLRTVLIELGCKEELKPEHAEARQKLVDIIAPCFTAPINYQRTYLVETGLAPKQPEKQKVEAIKAQA